LRKPALPRWQDRLDRRTRTLGVAVIGCGYWGTNYLRVLNYLPSVRLAAACDERAERLRGLEAIHPRMRVTTDLDSVLEDAAVDAVLLCTQATTHRDLGLRALEAGKHLLVEKPLATGTEECAQMIELAEAQGLTLMVGHTFLYNPAIEKVKEIVGDPASGPVYYLYARRTNLGPIRSDVNAVWDLSPHDVSIFNYLLEGQPRWVSAAGARPLRTSREDVAFMTLGYSDELLGHIHVSWVDPNKTREVVVVCENKRVVFNDLDPLERVRVFERGVRRRQPSEPTPDAAAEPTFDLREGRIVSPPVAADEPLKRQCEHFVQCVTTGGRPLTDGQLGLGVVRVMEAADRSIESSGIPVPVESEAAATVGGEHSLADSAG
jgi:predicted dehydrogenase